MDWKEIVGTIAALGLIALGAAALWSFFSSKPVKIIAGAVLLLCVGTILVMGSGFIAAYAITGLFSIEGDQNMIAIGVVASLCAALVAVAVAIGMSSMDLEAKLDLIAQQLSVAGDKKQ